MHPRWYSWLDSVWPLLKRKQKVQAPRTLPHPAHCGFARIDLAENHGQVDDWGVSLCDGSRVHVHEMLDGAFVAHRDKTDPSRGPVEAVWHFFTESQTGQVVAVGLLAGIVVGSLSGKTS